MPVVSPSAAAVPGPRLDAATPRRPDTPPRATGAPAARACAEPAQPCAPLGLRDRLRDHGASALSDAELLALWLYGRGDDAAALRRANGLLARFGSLHGLFTSCEAEWRGAPRADALGHARAQASLAIAARVLRAPLRAVSVLDSPQRVRDWLALWLAGREHEVFVVLFLDARHRLLGERELFRGTLTQTSVYPREVVKAALGANAAGVILAHNHPSGVAEPSRADEQLTTILRDALALVDVRVLDHFVVAREAVVSFAERGLL